MKTQIVVIFFILISYGGVPTASIFLIVPEDVSTGSAAIYGFIPRFLKGSDHRFGFGFRFGNHADLQILYELGPQIYTKPLQPVARVRSATYRQRVVRRRPFLEFLLRSGIVKETTARYDEYEHYDNDNDSDYNNYCDQPR